MITINPNNGKNIKVGRTTEGTLFELAGAVIIIILWSLTLWFYNNAPELIPTHFDITGKPDGYSDRSSLIILATIGSAIVAGTLCIAYLPQMISMPVKIRTASQYFIAIRLTRITAMQCGIMFILIAIMSGCGKESMTDVCSKLLFAVLMSIITVIIYYTEKLRRAGKKQD